MEQWANFQITPGFQDMSSEWNVDRKDERVLMSTQRENIERDGSVGRKFAVNDPPNLFPGLRGEDGFATSFTNFRGDPLHENPSILDGEHLAHQFLPGRVVSTNLAFEHSPISVS